MGRAAWGAWGIKSRTGFRRGMRDIRVWRMTYLGLCPVAQVHNCIRMAEAHYKSRVFTHNAARSGQAVAQKRGGTGLCLTQPHPIIQRPTR